MTRNLNRLQDIKIVIAGLDNAGKTSSLIALRQKYNFYERVEKLKPTIKIDYSSFDFLNKFTINLWDMGGQAKYRKIYVNNTIYFNGTDYLYFLIDIQDELNFEDAVNYLHDLLEIYRELDYTNEVIVCFNKFDPQYKENEEFNERTEMIKNLILIQNKDMDFKFFRMSIYDISSISKAISYSLNNLLNIQELTRHINEIGTRHNCDHIVLYTDSGLIISDYYDETLDTRGFQEHISKKVNEDLEFFQRLKDEQVAMNERITFSKDKTEYVKKYTIHSQEDAVVFYLGISTPPKKIHKIQDDLEHVQKALEDLVS
ncbi:MAG: GTP-binding protein [Promethearchaeota archaeon]|nr:MAG: GTP-binding protein [Candidatus Lokiarchaeota archaeon]